MGRNLQLCCVTVGYLSCYIEGPSLKDKSFALVFPVEELLQKSLSSLCFCLSEALASSEGNTNLELLFLLVFFNGFVSELVVPCMLLVSLLAIWGNLVVPIFAFLFKSACLLVPIAMSLSGCRHFSSSRITDVS